MNIDLSAAHIHLLLNHVPTIGFVFGLALLVFGWLLKSDHLKLASLTTLVGIALLSIPVYATGSGAHAQICGPLPSSGPCEDPSISLPLIQMHESLAFVSYVLIVFVGGLAWLGLWLFRRLKQVPTWNMAAVALLGLITFGVVAQAANVGGRSATLRSASARRPPSLPSVRTSPTSSTRRRGVGRRWRRSTWWASRCSSVSCS